MIKFRFNQKKIIPDVAEYMKIIASTIVVIYVIKVFLSVTFPGIFGSFPEVFDFKNFWTLLIFIFLVVYLKDLVDVKIGGRDYI